MTVSDITNTAEENGMFIEHKVYKHSNALDLMILVVSVHDVNEEGTTMYVKWMLPTSMGMLHEISSEVIGVKARDYKNWNLYVKDDKYAA